MLVSNRIAARIIATVMAAGAVLGLPAAAAAGTALSVVDQTVTARQDTAGDRDIHW